MKISHAIAALITLAASLNAAAQSYDPAAEFSATSNPSGVWSYGYSLTLGGSFILNTEKANGNGIDIWRTNISLGAPAVYHNPTANAISTGTPLIGAGALGLHPGPNDEYSIVRFTAPLAGNYRVSGSWYGQDTVGTTTDVHILVNEVSVFDGEVTGFGPGTGPSFDTTLTLGTGGVLDFAVGFGSDNNFFFDATGLSAQIAVVPVPEPSAWSMIGVGGVALLGIVLRRKQRTA